MTKQEQNQVDWVIEELIAVQARQPQKLNIFKEHKKGLMQQLFPATDEVHG